eukprot:539849-Pelagomonas_calceolata.AAC.1
MDCAMAAACTQQGGLMPLWAEGKIIDGRRVGAAPKGEGFSSLWEPGRRSGANGKVFWLEPTRVEAPRMKEWSRN